MSKTSRTQVTVPATAKKGSIIEIRAIVQHDMESGFRYTESGKLIPEILFVFLPVAITILRYLRPTSILV